MTKRLALFEFIPFNNIVDFRALVTDIVNNLKSIQENINRLNKTDIDVYAPIGVRSKLRAQAHDLVMNLHKLLQNNPSAEAVNSEVSYLEDLLYILGHFNSEQAVCTEIKAILAQAKKLMPDPEKLFDRATHAGRQLSDYEQVIPSDPTKPTPSAPTPEEAVRFRANHLRRLGI
ncbi:MAG: hypothetical protein JHC33_05100 [Ignisphaera sp.]|nr:hypothetical protein [Ignisphaera sp.]